jgi:diguanylate cyclase (GGDEF)-like protein/PAS domain S-box-containing protein
MLKAPPPGTDARVSTKHAGQAPGHRTTLANQQDQQRQQAGERAPSAAPPALGAFAPVLDELLDCIALLSADTRILYANPALCELTGSHREQLLGSTAAQQLQGFLGPEDFVQVVQNMRARFQHEPVVPQPRRMLRADGTERWVHIVSSPLEPGTCGEAALLVVIRDISSLKQVELELRQQREALHVAKERLRDHDGLTDLPRRRLFLDRLSQACVQLGRRGETVAVAVLDLDRFKMLNDSLGTHAGDQILQQVAQRLQHGLRAGDVVARLGTDEFGIVLVGVGRAEDAGVVVQRRLMGALASSFEIGQQRVVITASVGVALASTPDSSADQLIEDAYAALGRAKLRGGANFLFHEPGMNDRVMEFIQTQRSLVDALEKQEFRLHYQPIVSTTSGHIESLEALLRWQRPDIGLVPPGEFIPVLEETGLIRQVGAWVIGEAARQVGAWQREGVAVVPVAVNLSPVQFQDEGLLDHITDAVLRAGIQPELLAFELTESTYMDDIEHSRCLLQELQDRGHSIAVDDFGTGHSSLAYLESLPVNVLKIDMSFVRRLLTSPKNSAIIDAIITMARGLELRTLAEGVETHQQYARLQQLHCDLAQGWFRSPAVPPPQAAAMLGRLRG